MLSAGAFREAPEAQFDHAGGHEQSASGEKELAYLVVAPGITEDVSFTLQYQLAAALASAVLSVLAATTVIV